MLRIGEIGGVAGMMVILQGKESKCYRGSQIIRRIRNDKKL